MTVGLRRADSSATYHFMSVHLCLIFGPSIYIQEPLSSVKIADESEAKCYSSLAEQLMDL